MAANVPLSFKVQNLNYVEKKVEEILTFLKKIIFLTLLTN